MSNPDREEISYDVVIVGGGPAALSAAIRIKQLALSENQDTSVCILEKGSEIGAHIISGAVIDTQALSELLPNWKDEQAPLETEVKDDRYYYFTKTSAIRVPHFLLPPLMNNAGNYIGSLSNLCRWMATKAEAMGVEIYPGFPAQEVILEDGVVRGVVTGDFGIAKDGHRKDGFAAGMRVLGKYTIFAEGARGSLTRTLTSHFALQTSSEPQKYGIGLKELWELPRDKHKKGLVIHGFGWPLDNSTGGGLFMYHWGEQFCSVGFVVHLNYQNPYLDPFNEFQRSKTHPAIRQYLEGGKRIGYGARAITEGGHQSVPKLVFPGGALIGCAAGFVNVPRIKGTHNAIRTGKMAAEAAFEAVKSGRANDTLSSYEEGYAASAVFKDLWTVRNAKPLWSRLGTVAALPLIGLDLWTNQLCNFSFFGTMSHGGPDHLSLKRAKDCRPIEYRKPDNQITFDRLSSVFLSSTNHEEDQPVHLRLRDPAIPVSFNLAEYQEPAQRYCPAGVYEIVQGPETPVLQINAQNCVHCKTCDIKDPTQNITWTTPEGSGGPNYSQM